MSEIIFVVYQAPDGGYTACALGQSIFTQADTPAELRTGTQVELPLSQGPVAQNHPPALCA